MAEKVIFNNEELVVAKAISKFNIISPYKVRKVINKLRGMPYDRAKAILDFLPHKASDIVGKTLKSAYYNLDAVHKNVNPDEVFIYEVFASPGPVLKRIMPRARGRADRIKKRTSHITVVVATKMGDK